MPSDGSSRFWRSCRHDEIDPDRHVPGAISDQIRSDAQHQWRRDRQRTIAHLDRAQPDWRKAVQVAWMRFDVRSLRTAQGSATPKSRSTSPTVLTKNNNWAGYKWPALFCRNKRATQTLLQKSMVSAPHWDVDSSDLERRRAGCDRPALLFERPAEAILDSSGDSPDNPT